MLKSDLEAFRRRLLSWWVIAHRNFPWRNTRNPYHVFIAEVLLHRTRAAQVVELYRAVLSEFPAIGDLARADVARLRHVLHSAGLRWRVDLLHRAAQDILSRFSGNIPSGREELQTIPGVGHYIAAAIRCFAFGENDAIVDSNVVRVYGRMFGLSITDSLRRNREFHALAASLVDPRQPREYNLAVLDLAAAICTPRMPKCEVCPIAVHCIYGTRVLGLSPPPHHAGDS